MAERVLKAEISDIKLSAILYDEAFFMKKTEKTERSLSSLKLIHNHSNYEMFFVTGGCLSVVKGKDAVKCENSIVIIPPLLEHYRVGSDFEGYAFNFTIEKKENSKKHLYEDIVSALSSDIVLLDLTENEKFYISHIADCMNGKYPREILTHLVLLLFYELFFRIKPQPPESGKQLEKQAKYINKIENYIDRHYSEEISLADVAAAVNLSTKQTSRIIHRAYMCSFTELVTQQRLSKACMLLRYTDLSAREIAGIVGYRERENYFLALFKKRYNVTSMQYRQQSRQILTDEDPYLGI